MLDRIRDRKLFQWTLAYLAASWVLLQLYDVLAEPLGWSSAVFSVLVVVLAIGFAATLVLAWYHGEIGRQTVSGPELLILASLLVLAGVGVSLVSSRPRSEGGPGSEPAASTDALPLDPRAIAVLPFQNVSTDADDAFFADGMHEEVIARLSKISALRVISRSSVMQYRDAPDGGIPVIARELSVGSILEGSVRRAGQKVRITARLIDARADRPLWSDDWDRDLSADNVFAIQTEIASRVAQELEATLSPEEISRVAERPTGSLQAYEFWLRGNASRNIGYDERDVRRSIAMYEQAVELDPGFGLAYARLARAHDDMRWFGYDVSDARDRQARLALAEAARLQPGHPETEVASGYIAYHRLAYDSALAHFERARSTDPNWNEPVAAIAFVLRRQGRFEEALTGLAEAIEMDPNSARQFFNSGETALLLRKCDEAERYFNRALTLTPSWARAHAYIVWTNMACRGDLEQARTALDAAVEVVANAEDPYLNRAAVLVEVFSRRYEDALRRIDLISTPNVAEQFFLLPRSFLRGEVLRLMGNDTEATAAFEEARRVLEAEKATNPSDDRVRGTLGLTYAYLGLTDRAVREGEQGVALMPRDRDAYKALYRAEDLTRIVGILGRPGEATRLWSDLLAGPGIITRQLLSLDPRLDALRQSEAFAELYR